MIDITTPEQLIHAMQSSQFSMEEKNKLLEKYVDENNFFVQLFGKKKAANNTSSK